jgi:hypothetical protein
MTPRKDVHLLQINLNASQRALLLREFPAVHHGKVTAEHITVAFEPKAHEFEAFRLGASVIVRAIGYAEDDRGQAVAVTAEYADSSLPVAIRNPIPHITISVAEGTKPVYSNKLLEAGHKSVKGEPFFVGTCVAVLRNGNVIDSE